MNPSWIRTKTRLRLTQQPNRRRVKKLKVKTPQEKCCPFPPEEWLSHLKRWMKTYSVSYFRSNDLILVPFWYTISEVRLLVTPPPIKRISPSGLIQLECPQRKFTKLSVSVDQEPDSNFMQLFGLLPLPMPPHAVSPDWEWLSLDCDIWGEPLKFFWKTSHFVWMSEKSPLP